MTAYINNKYFAIKMNSSSTAVTVDSLIKDDPFIAPEEEELDIPVIQDDNGFVIEMRYNNRMAVLTP